MKFKKKKLILFNRHSDTAPISTAPTTTMTPVTTTANSETTPANPNNNIPSWDIAKRVVFSSSSSSNSTISSTIGNNSNNSHPESPTPTHDDSLWTAPAPRPSPSPTNSQLYEDNSDENADSSYVESFECNLYIIKFGISAFRSLNPWTMNHHIFFLQIIAF